MLGRRNMRGTSLAPLFQVRRQAGGRATAATDYLHVAAVMGGTSDTGQYIRPQGLRPCPALPHASSDPE
jgi:hypothetical protein